MSTTPLYLPKVWPANNTNFPRRTYEQMPGEIIKNWQYISSNDLTLSAGTYNLSPTISFAVTDSNHLYRFKGAFKLYSTNYATPFVAMIQHSVNGGAYANITQQSKNCLTGSCYNYMFLRMERRYSKDDIVIVRLSITTPNGSKVLSDSSFTCQQIWLPVDPTMQGVDSTTAWTFS